MNHTGLPFSDWLAVVTPGWNIPLNAVYISIGFTTLLALVSNSGRMSSTVSHFVTSPKAATVVQAGTLIWVC